MNSIIKQQIAKEARESIYAAHPELVERFGENGIIHTEKDNMHHLDHLETAYSLKQTSLFLDYTKWLQTVLESRNVGTHLIIDNFERLIEILPGKVDLKEEEFMIQSLKEAIHLLDN
ncbi:hypothetical protein [Planomicrobium sp. CPCC 101079]|uniref:hypothetical protein n=1 Tax=Planomicrobium sp. CPCC 101079 TaxID=2599618 RepID=UPI0011B4408E|nr:hypothetical protein [Planomicrobium sp. CPCC 101079]TWT03724.1 hypothetical protein FQV28_11960 [Planomicrobium sp. CPCC 101079]